MELQRRGGKPRQGNTTPRIGNTTPKVGNTTPKIGNTAPKIGNSTPRTGTAGIGTHPVHHDTNTGDSGSTYRPRNVAAKTEYIFRKNVPLAYYVQIDHVNPMGSERWMGAVVFDTVSPTPLREDGTGYDYATVNTLGKLTAYAAAGKGELRRNSTDDIILPTKLNFRTLGVSDHKMPEGGRTKLPGDMNRALGVVEAIFPDVPLFEGKKQHDIYREYWLQTSEGHPAGGSISKVGGSGVATQSAQGNRAERTETMQVKNHDGSPLFGYQLHQVATFDGNRQLTSAKTIFKNTSHLPSQIVVTTRKISVQQAMQMLRSAK